MTYRAIVVLFALCIQTVWPAVATAQPAPAACNCDAAAMAALQAERDQLKKQYDEAVASNEILSKRTISLIQQLRKAPAAASDSEIYKIDVQHYRLWGEHNLLVFRMTLVENTVLLIVVLTVVFCGLYFSYMQLRTAMTAGATTVVTATEASGDAAKPTAGPSLSATSLELSPSGVKVTSSIAGVIILAMSLGFFYLYLKEVYPIKFYDAAQGASGSSPGPPPAR